jgi:hypothetical protein
MKKEFGICRVFLRKSAELQAPAAGGQIILANEKCLKPIKFIFS